MTEDEAFNLRSGDRVMIARGMDLDTVTGLRGGDVGTVISVQRGEIPILIDVDFGPYRHYTVAAKELEHLDLPASQQGGHRDMAEVILGQVVHFRTRGNSGIGTVLDITRDLGDGHIRTIVVQLGTDTSVPGPTIRLYPGEFQPVSQTSYLRCQHCRVSIVQVGNAWVHFTTAVRNCRIGEPPHLQMHSPDLSRRELVEAWLDD